VVQTATPGHPAIRFAAKHDFEGFAAHESRLRAELNYPPHGRLIRLVIEDKDAVLVEKSARELADWLRPQAEAEKLVLLGPAEAPISLLRGKTRWHLLVKGSANGKGLVNVRTKVFEWLAAHPKVRVAIDVDPVSLM
jgi:primosomal protein N' (replication factor Y)